MSSILDPSSPPSSFLNPALGLQPETFKWKLISKLKTFEISSSRQNFTELISSVYRLWINDRVEKSDFFFFGNNIYFLLAAWCIEKLMIIKKKLYKWIMIWIKEEKFIFLIQTPFLIHVFLFFFFYKSMFFFFFIKTIVF